MLTSALSLAGKDLFGIFGHVLLERR